MLESIGVKPSSSCDGTNAVINNDSLADRLQGDCRRRVLSCSSRFKGLLIPQEQGALNERAECSMSVLLTGISQ